MRKIRFYTIDDLYKATDEWEIPKRPWWHRDPWDEEAEGLRARAKYEKKEMERPSGKVKPFSRVRRGKLEHVKAHERKVHGYPAERSPYQHIMDRQKAMDVKFAPLKGARVKTIEGTFEFTRTNDLGIPYFAKVTENKVGKKEFVLSGYRREWAEERLRTVALHLQRPPISNLGYKRIMKTSKESKDRIDAYNKWKAMDEAKRKKDYAGTGSTGGMFP